ncbi:uncharacterized protein DS421_20g694430 [Arachis hypogaea]|nr:uncharacterized protein DS421_20g694430 [Arachis hypogaea]
MTNLANATQANDVVTKQVLERMAQHVGNGNDGRHGNSDRPKNCQVDSGLMMLATFLKVNPLVFKGSTSPTESDNWFQAIERAVKALENQFEEFTAYLLAGEAQFWWQGAHRLLQQGNENVIITWKMFKEKLYNK